MSSPVLAEKTCTKCGETKPLTAFHRHNTNRDGRRGDCATCTTAYVKEQVAKRRAEMGDEAWLQQQRDRVAASRASRKGREAARAHSRRRSEAVRELVANHRTEFDAIMARLKYEEGTV